MSFRESFSYFWTAFVQWVKEHTTADALTDGVKTASWVVPLTILIWVYAEQEQPTAGNDQVVLIKVRSTDPDRLVTVLNPSDENATVTMKGPRSSIDQVKRLLDQQGEAGRLINVDVPSSFERGEQNVNISSAIEQARIFKSNGVVVSDVVPSYIKVRIDQIKTYDLPVVAPPDVNLDGPAIFEPKTVKVRMPERTYDAAAKNSLEAVAQFPSTGDAAKPGEHDDVKLPVKLPAGLEGEKVTPVSSLNVVANYKIKTSSVPGEIDPLLIRTLYTSPGLADQIQVVLPSPVLRHVQISGPKEKVEKVIANAKTNQDPIPYAIVSIDQKDVDALKDHTSATVTKTPTYDFRDPDVTPTPEQMTRTIDVQIVKRTSASQ